MTNERSVTRQALRLAAEAMYSPRADAADHEEGGIALAAADGAEPHANAECLAQLTLECPDPVLRVDALGEVAGANAAGMRLLDELGTPATGPVPPDWRDIVQCVLHTRQTPELHVQGGEKTYLLRLLPNPEAEHVNIYGRDVTERIALEQRIRESDARLSAVLESAGDGILMVGAAGRIEVANKAAEQIFGRSRRELIGLPLDDVLMTGDSQQGAEGTANTKLVSQHSEAVLHRPNGTTVDVELSITAVAHRGACTIVMRDVTQRKLLEQEARELHARLVETARRAGQYEVASGVLHNVGNVLNSIGVSTALLSEQLGSSEIHCLKQALGTIPNDTPIDHYMANDPRGKLLAAYLFEALQKLIDEHATLESELAGLTRKIEHVSSVVVSQQSITQMPRVKQTANAVALLDEAVSIVGVEGTADITVHRSYCANAQVTTDKHRVLEILINLVANAVDAVEESGRSDKRIDLSVTEDNEFLSLIVADNGAGISAEHKERIFGHGFTTKPHGHGFGLHSAVTAAQALGGSLSAESDGSGQGAQFILRLPRGTEGA